MNILTVSITQARIDNAARLGFANPLTKAIGRATNRIGCYVIGNTVYDEGVKLFNLTKEMAHWLVLWMEGAKNAFWMYGETAQPATFEVVVPAGVRLGEDDGTADNADIAA